jgi:hypothetical protein
MQALGFKVDLVGSTTLLYSVKGFHFGRKAGLLPFESSPAPYSQPHHQPRDQPQPSDFDDLPHWFKESNEKGEGFYHHLHSQLPLANQS